MIRSSGFVFPEEIDILSYAIKLKQYWWSFLLAFVVGICGGYLFLLKTLPLPSTQAIVVIGFPDIFSGKYPDGRRFDKNDLASFNIVRKTVGAIPELGQNSPWSPESLYSALTVSEVYPIDVQLAFEALSGSTKAKLTPQDVVSSYEKINNYFPSRFTVSFQPSPLMPMSLQKKFMEELIKQYSAFVLESRIPLSLNYIRQGLVPAEMDNVATYGYIAAALNEVDDQIAASTKKTFVSATNTTNTTNTSDIARQNRTGGNDEEFVRLSQSANSITLQKLKMEMASVEHLIFNEKTVPNLNEYRNKLTSDISLLSNEMEIRKKQAEYKMNLARIPSQNAPKANVNPLDNSSQSVDKTIVGILLSYNAQYYSLMNEINVIFDEISRMEGRLAKLKERLKLLDTAGRVTSGTYEARNKALGEHVKLAQSHLVIFVNEVAENTRAAYAGYRPPVANYSVFGETTSISRLKTVLAGLTTVFIMMVFLLLKILVNDAEAQGQAAIPAPREIGGEPKGNVKK